MSSNQEKFDFSPVYNSIKRYYPLENEKNSNADTGSSKHEELVRMIIENIHDENNYKTRWQDFCVGLEKELSKKIIGTTYGQLPCFSAYIELDKQQIEDLIRTKELHFFVSLLGPYYTIIGKDKSSIEYEPKHYYWITNSLTVSPQKEYADVFTALETRIEEKFFNYRFVPFELLFQKAGVLYPNFYENEELTIFNALFNNQIIHEKYISGDKFYKSGQWLNKDYNPESEGGWTIYPPEFFK